MPNENTSACYEAALRSYASGYRQTGQAQAQTLIGALSDDELQESDPGFGWS